MGAIASMERFVLQFMAQYLGKKKELQNYKKIAQVAGGQIPVLINHKKQPPLDHSSNA
jgi:hypothetical protein